MTLNSEQLKFLEHFGTEGTEEIAEFLCLNNLIVCQTNVLQSYDTLLQELTLRVVILENLLEEARESRS